VTVHSADLLPKIDFLFEEFDGINQSKFVVSKNREDFPLLDIKYNQHKLFIMETLYEHAGGLDALHRLSDIFYHIQ
jgi:hypothetical protein